MSSEALTSFAATGDVHRHVCVYGSMGDKYAQLMSFVTAYVACPEYPQLQRMTLGDFVLTVEAARLHVPLAMVLELMHPDDLVELCRDILTWHRDSSGKMCTTRRKTVESLVQAVARSLRCNDGGIRREIAEQAHAIAKGNECKCLKDLLRDDTMVTKVTVENDAKLVGFYIESLLQDTKSQCHLEMETLFIDLIEEFVQLCTRQCSENVDISLLATFDSYEAFVASCEDNTKKDENIPSVCQKSWWLEETTYDSAIEGPRSFARLISQGSLTWQSSDIEWLQTYLSSVHDITALSVMVESILRQPAFAAASIETSYYFNTLLLSDEDKCVRSLLCCAAFAPKETLLRMISDGVNFLEYSYIFIRVLKLAPSLLSLSNDSNLLIYRHLSTVVKDTTQLTMLATERWIKCLSDAKSGVLSTCNIVQHCILPWLEIPNNTHNFVCWHLVNEFLQANNVWPSCLKIEILNKSCSMLQLLWTSTVAFDKELAQLIIQVIQILVPSLTVDDTKNHLQPYFQDVRFQVLLHNSLQPRPLTLPKAWSDKSKAYTLDLKDVENLLWAAVLGASDGIVLLNSLSEALQKDQLIVTTASTRLNWTSPFSFAALIVSKILPRVTPLQLQMLISTVLPSLLATDGVTIDIGRCVVHGTTLRWISIDKRLDIVSLEHTIVCLEALALKTTLSLTQLQEILKMLLWLVRMTISNDYLQNVLVLSLRKIVDEWYQRLSESSAQEFKQFSLQYLNKNIAQTQLTYPQIYGILASSQLRP